MIVDCVPLGSDSSVLTTDRLSTVLGQLDLETAGK